MVILSTLFIHDRGSDELDRYYIDRIHTLCFFVTTNTFVVNSIVYSLILDKIYSAYGTFTSTGGTVTSTGGGYGNVYRWYR